MAPKRKAASKPKYVTSASPDNMTEQIDNSNIIVKQPSVKYDTDKCNTNLDNKESPILDKNLRMSAVIIKNLPEFINKVLEYESEISDDEEEPNKKIMLKKIKGKPKTKNQLIKDKSKNKKIEIGAFNEDNLTKAEEKAVSTSHKKPVDKDISNVSTLICSSNKLPKRNQRAENVDLITSETSSSFQESKKNKKILVNEDVTSMKIKKAVKKKEPLKPSAKITKSKLNPKKLVNDEEEILSLLELNPINIQKKLNSKRGSKEEQLVNDKEDEKDIKDEIENTTKQISKSRAASKLQQESKKLKHIPKSKQTTKLSNESEELSETNDSISKSPVLKSKLICKDKGNTKSPPTSEESNSKNDVDGTATKPAMKNVRVRKGNNTNDNSKVLEDNIKLPKRNDCKVERKDFEEEVMHKSPSLNDINTVKTGDLPDDISVSPESDKNENKQVVKRKLRAKIVRK